MAYVLKEGPSGVWRKERVFDSAVPTAATVLPELPFLCRAMCELEEIRKEIQVSRPPLVLVGMYSAPGVWARD